MFSVILFGGGGVRVSLVQVPCFRGLGYLWSHVVSGGIVTGASFMTMRMLFLITQLVISITW